VLTLTAQYNLWNTFLNVQNVSVRDREGNPLAGNSLESAI